MRRYGNSRHAKLILLSLLSIALLAGCHVKFATKIKPIKDANIITVSHRVAANMIKQSEDRLDPGQLIVTSFANVDDLRNSSTFGRIIAQQIGSGFSNRGHPVIELLLRDTVYIGIKEGEFLLSRALKDLTVEHDAQAVIVGTYAIGKNNVYVTTKLIRASDTVVIAAEDFALPLGPDVKKLVSIEEEG